MQSLDPTFEAEETQNEVHLMQIVCSECKAIFDNWYERDNWSSARPGHTHHSIVGLQQSASTGCPICALLLRELDHDTIQELLRKRPNFKGLVSVQEKILRLVDQYFIKVGFCDEPPSDLKGSWETAINIQPSVGRYLGKVQDVVDCEENWALARKWLRVCQDTHTECFWDSMDRELPTRLIGVGVNDQDLKLCYSSSLTRETQYLTLSHCWGGKVFTTLTRSNFETFLSHIPTETLSKTFKEAIATTRNLGFKYLWIDSLCIIQGDEVDWRQEASRMGIVYANSALNIAASSAPNGEFGCFSARKPDQMYGYKVMARTRRDPAQTSMWDCTVRDFTLRIMHDNVLSSRAWVYQEYFLAPRTLHFTVHQLFWECISSRACESFPGSYYDGSCTRPGLKNSRIRNNDGRDIAGNWSDIAVQYSNGAVTFRRDKLVALSGVARLFAARFGTSYLAGMWKEDLVRQLIWKTSQPSELDAKSSVPSWSWASINTPVYWPFYSDPHELVSILEATTVAVDDSFGDVKEGTIRMRCCLPCIATIIEQHLFPWFSIRCGSRRFLSQIYPDTKPYSIGDDLYLVAFLLGNVVWSDGELLCGLIIEPVEPTSYRRTGYFQLYDESMDGFIEAQDEATSENKDFVGEVLGPDEDGNEMCIITLI